METNMSVAEQLEMAKPEPTVEVISLGVFLGLITVLTIGGNLLVVLAVSLVKKLRTPSNFLIVSLAVSDVLVGVTAMPLAEFKQLVGSWTLGEALCDMYIVFDVLLCTASILNLCAISIDRYLAITRPLQYAAKRTPKRMMLMIAIVWVVSALISIPPIFGFKETFIPGMCEYSSNIIYQIYATAGAFYIPLIVMIVLYGRIFILARRMAQEDAKQKRVTESVANQYSSTYNYRNGRPSTVPSEDLKMFTEQGDLYDGPAIEVPDRTLHLSLFRRSNSEEPKPTGNAKTEKYPLPPSELCRRRKPRQLYWNNDYAIPSLRTEVLLQKDDAPKTARSLSKPKKLPELLLVQDSISTEPKSPSGLSCTEEFEDRVRTLRRLRAEFFAAPPSRHCSSVILNFNQDDSLSRDSTMRPLSHVNDTALIKEDNGSSQPHRSPLHHSQTMRETVASLPVEYKPQSRGSMPPPPKLSISYYSDDPSIIASPSQVSDALTTWTIIEHDQENLTSQPQSKSGPQAIPRPRPRPTHGARRSVTNAVEYVHKNCHQTRQSLLGLPSRSKQERRRSSPMTTDPYEWNTADHEHPEAKSGSVQHVSGIPTELLNRRPSYLERSTSRLFNRSSDHGLVPPQPSRSRAASWASTRIPLRKRRPRGHSETKAIKTLGVIMGCFCLCWVPFFIIARLMELPIKLTSSDPLQFLDENILLETQLSSV
ncbi:5-hydroxytryptamine receptor 1 [Fasciola hepatica]|uniref:5-hydroxytryptamine receptor 1 n=1 Tax=Fasciola hepatica TaxID=6192 RepID=A0A4E0RWR7_FASHE|nr:5-hydroxytryptamine receptor 1 [Fasciola hepatica]